MGCGIERRKKTGIEKTRSLCTGVYSLLAFLPSHRVFSSKSAFFFRRLHLYAQAESNPRHQQTQPNRLGSNQRTTTVQRNLHCERQNLTHCGALVGEPLLNLQHLSSCVRPPSRKPMDSCYLAHDPALAVLSQCVWR